MANSPQDSLPPTISTIRRRLIAATADAEPPDHTADSASDSVDFDSLGVNGLMREELEQASRESPVQDEVEVLLQRYQAEKGRKTPTEVRLDPAAVGLPPLSRVN